MEDGDSFGREAHPKGQNKLNYLIGLGNMKRKDDTLHLQEEEVCYAKKFKLSISFLLMQATLKLQLVVKVNHRIITYD